MKKGAGIRQDHLGKRFGKWLVLSLGEPWRGPNQKQYVRRWLCRCDCGTEILVAQNSLVHGRSKSCLSCSAKISSKTNRACFKKGQLAGNFENLVGQKHNGMLVSNGPLKLQDRKTNYWNLLCLKCGRTYLKSTGQVKNSGCGDCSKRKGLEHPSWKGGTWISDFNIQKKRALDRGLCWEFSLKDFQQLSTQKCFYCHQDPSKHSRGNVRNSLDRMDSSKGYRLDNVVAACFTCNRNKGAMPFPEFLEWVKSIYKCHF